MTSICRSIFAWLFQNALRASICLALIFLGCATTQGPQPLDWQCDSRADDAVTSGQWEAARSGHQALLLKDPQNCLALYHLGYIWGRLEARAREIDYYQQAISCGYVRDDQLYFNLGMALGDMNDPDGALAAFDRAVAIDPGNADNHFGQGIMAQAAGQEMLAESALQKAVSLAPQHWEARLLLVQIYLDRSSWAEARSQLEAVLTGKPNYPDALNLWQTMLSRQREAYDGNDE